MASSESNCWRYTRFGVEDVAADSFRNGHAEVDKKSDSRDADSGIVLVGACQECGVVMMVVSMVRMAEVASCLLHADATRTRLGER